MSNIFDSPDVEYVETPSETETTEEIVEQKKKERESLGAFFSALRTGGADELRSPSSTTGLQL